MYSGKTRLTLSKMLQLFLPHLFCFVFKESLNTPSLNPISSGWLARCRHWIRLLFVQNIETAGPGPNTLFETSAVDKTTATGTDGRWLLGTGEARTGHSILNVALQGQGRGQEHLSRPAGHAFLMHPGHHWPSFVTNWLEQQHKKYFGQSIIIYRSHIVITGLRMWLVLLDTQTLPKLQRQRKAGISCKHRISNVIHRKKNFYPH